MPRIITNTGEEHERRRGAKGYVFLRDPMTGEEKYIFFASATLIDEDPWVGQWRKQEYEVAEGAIIKLAGGSLHGIVPSDYANAYFVVREGLPTVKALCTGVREHRAYVIGPLEMIPYAELETRLGIKVKAQYKKYYRNTAIIVEPTEEPVQLH